MVEEETHEETALEVPVESSILKAFDAEEREEAAIAHSSVRSQPLSLQEQLDREVLENSGDRPTVKLHPPNQEYLENIIINSSLSLDGQGATICALSGPVLSINSDNVTLCNLRVEVTGEHGKIKPEDSCAIWIKPGIKVQLNNIEVRGSVMGILAEEGEWEYPNSLNLGRLAYGQGYELLLRVIVPVDCQIDSKISGLNFQPKHLQAGANEIRIEVERLPQDTLINGNIFLVSSAVKRRIAFNACIVSLSEGQVLPPPDVIWEAKNWSNILSSQSSLSETEGIVDTVESKTDENFLNEMDSQPEESRSENNIKPTPERSEKQRNIRRGERPNPSLFRAKTAVESDPKIPATKSYQLGSAFSSPNPKNDLSNNPDLDRLNPNDCPTNASQKHQLGDAFCSPEQDSTLSEEPSSPSVDKNSSSKKGRSQSISPLFQQTPSSDEI